MLPLYLMTALMPVAILIAIVLKLILVILILEQLALYLIKDIAIVAIGRGEMLALRNVQLSLEVPDGRLEARLLQVTAAAMIPVRIR